MANRIILCDDADLLRFEPHLEERFPHKGNVAAWQTARQEASNEIERRLRARRAQSGVFTLGQLGLRSREQLRDVAAWFSLHYLHVGGDVQGDPAGFFERKAAYYWGRATQGLDHEATALDYDADNDGTVEDDEKQRPFPTMMLRG